MDPTFLSIVVTVFACLFIYGFKVQMSLFREIRKMDITIKTLKGISKQIFSSLPEDVQKEIMQSELNKLKAHADELLKRANKS